MKFVRIIKNIYVCDVSLPISVDIHESVSRASAGTIHLQGTEFVEFVVLSLFPSVHARIVL